MYYGKDLQAWWESQQLGADAGRSPALKREAPSCYAGGFVLGCDRELASNFFLTVTYAPPHLCCESGISTYPFVL